MTIEQWTIERILNWTRGHFEKVRPDSPRLDAELLVRGLRFTEMMSTHLPFFDQVCAVSDWIIGELDMTFPGISET